MALLTSECAQVNQRVVKQDLIAIVEVGRSAVIGSNAVPCISKLRDFLAEMPSCNVDIDARVHQVTWSDAVLLEFRQVDGVDATSAIVESIVGVFRNGLCLATGLDLDDCAQDSRVDCMKL